MLITTYYSLTLQPELLLAQHPFYLIKINNKRIWIVWYIIIDVILFMRSIDIIFFPINGICTLVF